jgi:hypothetical protein
MRELDDLRAFAAHSIDQDRYRSYLLRLWREAPGGPWRCQTRCVATCREWRFAGLEELFEFLAADAACTAGEMRRDRKTW